MPYLVKISAHGVPTYCLMANKPRLVGKEIKYIRETNTRCLGFEKIEQAEFDLGLTKVLRDRFLAQEQRGYHGA